MTPMPSPSLTLSARFPLMSTMDVVRPAIFHRGSFPTAVKSRFSADCAAACVAIHASAAMRHSLAFVVCSIRYSTVVSKFGLVCDWHYSGFLLRGLASLRGVEAFAIDRGHFRAHR